MIIRERAWNSYHLKRTSSDYSLSVPKLQISQHTSDVSEINLRCSRRKPSDEDFMHKPRKHVKLFYFVHTSMQNTFKCSGVVRGGQGGDGPLPETLPPLAPQMKLHFVQRSMESRHFESQSAPFSPLSPPCCPSFWKVWLHPCSNVTDLDHLQNAYIFYPPFWKHISKHL